MVLTGNGIRVQFWRGSLTATTSKDGSRRAVQQQNWLDRQRSTGCHNGGMNFCGTRLPSYLEHICLYTADMHQPTMQKHTGMYRLYSRGAGFVQHIVRTCYADMLLH